MANASRVSIDLSWTLLQLVHKAQDVDSHTLSQVMEGSTGSIFQSRMKVSSKACTSSIATREPGHCRAPAENGALYKVWSSMAAGVPLRAAWSGR